MKDPCILLYTSDFLSAAALLSMRERGQFITLMCLQHQHGHLSLADMRRAVGSIPPPVMKLFCQDEEGNFYNQRVDETIERRRKASDLQRQRVAKRWNNAGNTAVLPGESEREKEKGSNVSWGGGAEEGAEDFDRFWALYPRKKGKADARKAWQSVPGERVEELLAALRRQRECSQWQEDGGRYVPYPATWLRGRRWEDEPDAAPAAGGGQHDGGETHEMRALRELARWKKAREAGG